MDPTTFINEHVYTPVWLQKVAEYTGIQFENAEEDLMARQLVQQFINAQNMRKQAQAANIRNDNRSIKGALYQHMNKLASYATGAPHPDAVSVYNDLHQLTQDQELGKALDAINL